MKFNKVINEITVDSGQVGSFIDRRSEDEIKDAEEEKKKEKRKRSRKRVFGTWFSRHNNRKYI